MECFVLKAERLKLCTVTQNRKKSYCFSSSSSSSHSKTASVQKADRCFLYQGTSHDDKIIINIGERSKRPSHTWGWHQSVLKESWDDAVGKKWFTKLPSHVVQTHFLVSRYKHLFIFFQVQVLNRPFFFSFPLFGACLCFLLTSLQAPASGSWQNATKPRQLHLKEEPLLLAILIMSFNISLM